MRRVAAAVAVAVLGAAGLLAVSSFQRGEDACGSVESTEAAYLREVEEDRSALNAEEKRLAGMSTMEQLNHGNGAKVRAQQALQASLRSWALLVEQNPDCFEPDERVTAGKILGR